MQKYHDLNEISLQERLERCDAELKGLSLVMNKLLKNIVVYSDFLEDELEDSASGERYLEKLRHDIEQIKIIYSTISQDLETTVEEQEKVNLSALLTAFFKRTRKLRDLDDVNLVNEQEELIIQANMSHLSSVFMFMHSLLAKDKTYTLSVEKVNMSEQEALNDGIYYSIELKSSDSINDYVPVNYDAAVFEESDRREMLFVLGALKRFSGALYCNENDEQISLQLLLPSMDFHAVGGQLDDDLNADSLKGTETILVVDDEDMIWDVLIENLQNLGYIVLLAENGLDAVEIYRENPGQIDLVILDMVMPEMNGREAFYELKKLDDEVKVLISSGFMAENEAGDLIEAGAAAFLRKPYRMVELARKLRELLT
ncbi:response regulator [Lentisphaera profundi]|uniref:Response regulator n=1 Tax=Lentisphaera profundi TaxID=1658616 RepID=A0ABY7VYI0_9BACT|nr:response regulator [Lentisphaera profundi]WDE98260.1 response regulator [Lentisphaera profundi]